MRNMYSNPFISCTARDMSYADVMKFWCSPFECYRINERTLNESVTPIIIEGARGSGKTMLLKHQSYFCQREKYEDDSILKCIKEAGYLCAYFRYSADYSSLFESLNCSEYLRSELFKNYFQLCLCMEIAKILSDVEKEFSDSEKERLWNHLSSITDTSITSCEAFVSWVETTIHKQDEIIRNSQYSDIEEKAIHLTNMPLFRMIHAIHSDIELLKDVLIIITIDEFENIGLYQKEINTYIKQMNGEEKYSFRIGVRPEGIVSNYKTDIGQEFLQDGRDFIQFKLEVPMRQITRQYKKFVTEVIDRRLHSIPLLDQLNITIEKMLGSSENYDLEAKEIVRGRKKHLSDVLMGKTTEEAERIKDAISDDNPIVEAYFVMRMKRGLPIEGIIQTKHDITSGDETALSLKYSTDMKNKYKAALLFWLLSVYVEPKLYYSLDTYLYLSCGSIYDFIGLCRNLFDELESDYFNTMDENARVSPKLQTHAAKKYAESQMEKLKINHEYGTKMWIFTRNMCNLFSFYHKGDLCVTYPETNQFYIKGEFDSSGVSQEIWRSLLKWGVVIKKSAYQRASLSENNKVQLCYINKIYYPIYNISCRIRGGYNVGLTDELWSEMLIPNADPEIIIKRRTDKKKTKKNSNDDSHMPSQYEQISMF